MAKWKPLLMSVIHKFNTYCTQLKELHDLNWSIPIPRPLLTKLNELQNDDSLMEDVWITLSLRQIPHWMDDKNIHHRTCTMLKHDWCIEEQQRVGIEANNLCCWYGNELTTV